MFLFSPRYGFVDLERRAGVGDLLADPVSWYDQRHWRWLLGFRSTDAALRFRPSMAIEPNILATAGEDIHK